MQTQRKNLVLPPTTSDTPNLRAENPKPSLLLAEPLVDRPSQLRTPAAVLDESVHQRTCFSIRNNDINASFRACCSSAM